nr:carboxymuconolactone decarboxylase family protein [candidate division Zixibacteria bacterium]
MSRFDTINIDMIDNETKELLNDYKNGHGMTPNLIKGLACSPAVLKGYYLFNEALSHGQLNDKLQLLISLMIAELNGSSYCLAANSALSRMAGINEEEMLMARRASAADRRVDRALKFARAVLITRGRIQDSDIQEMKTIGYSDSEIVEIIAHISLNILTNLFAEVAQTPVGFPKVKPLTIDQEKKNPDVHYRKLGTAE